MICLLLAYPLVWLIARSSKRHRDLLVLLVILPLASNFLIRIYAWIILLGPAALAAGDLGWRGAGLHSGTRHVRHSRTARRHA